MRPRTRAALVVAVSFGAWACNALTGVNDYSTPSCQDCERKECPAEFSACAADRMCALLTMCIAACPAGALDCVSGCQMPPDAGGEAMDGGNGGAGANLVSCAQTRCAACELTPPAGAMHPPGTPDASSR